ncbi:iron chaperone [Microbacterium sp. 22242]|uniref:iron chaperone n=1 Tax=Microbacterium sp. 22242 TaxID=3453896 RepID=UPI003F853142
MGVVDDYLAEVQDPGDRQALARVYQLAQEIVPDAEQGTGYRMPALTHDGKVLISAIRAARHIGIYPFSAAAIAAVAPRVEVIEGAESSAGAIRFAPGASIPDELIRDLVSFRLAEIDGR